LRVVAADLGVSVIPPSGQRRALGKAARHLRHRADGRMGQATLAIRFRAPEALSAAASRMVAFLAFKVD
jgi:hypothetical protein